MAGRFRLLLNVAMVGIYLATTSFSCTDDKDPEHVFMSFTIPLSVHPPGEEMRLGDTLWIEGSFPDTLQEYHSGVYYKFREFDFKTKLCAANLTNSEKYFWEQPGISVITVSEKDGNFSNPGSLCGDITFEYRNGQYHYSYGVVPHSTGLITIGFLMPVYTQEMENTRIRLEEIIELKPAADGTRRIPVYEAFLYVVNDGDTHFELFAANAKVGSISNPEDWINVNAEQKGTFTFRVVE